MNTYVRAFYNVVESMIAIDQSQNARDYMTFSSKPELHELANFINAKVKLNDSKLALINKIIKSIETKLK